MSFQDVGPRRQIPMSRETDPAVLRRRRLAVQEMPPPSNRKKTRSRNSRKSREHRKRLLMQEESSLLDEDDESPMIVSRTVRQSRFSQLTTEISNFQKIVADLESILDKSRESPELQWRSRILMRSAQETDQDIAEKLFQYETTLWQPTSDPSLQAQIRTEQTACLKLHRDFRRIHKGLVMLVTQYERNQQAEVAMLGRGGWSADRHMLDEPYQESKEDYFERRMRERETELNRINRSMHKVNQIYQELAEYVHHQQDKVDEVEKELNTSRSTTEKGLEHLEQARRGSCSSLGPGCAPMGLDDDVLEDPPRARSLPARLADARRFGYEKLACGAASSCATKDDEEIVEYEQLSRGRTKDDDIDATCLSEDGFRWLEVCRAEFQSTQSDILGFFELFPEQTTGEEKTESRGAEGDIPAPRASSRGGLRRPPPSSVEYKNKKSAFESFSGEEKSGYPPSPRVGDRDMPPPRPVSRGRYHSAIGVFPSSSSLEQREQVHNSRALKEGEDDATETPSLRIDQEFHWTMPFETIQADFEAVKKDMLSLGKEIVSKASR